MANKVKIYAAHEAPLHVVINIEEEMPELEAGPVDKWLELSHQRFETEAKRLHEALVYSLPGGTYDRLLAEMVKWKASNLRCSRMKEQQCT